MDPRGRADNLGANLSGADRPDLILSEYAKGKYNGREDIHSAIQTLIS